MLIFFFNLKSKNAIIQATLIISSKAQEWNLCSLVAEIKPGPQEIMETQLLAKSLQARKKKSRKKFLSLTNFPVSSPPPPQSPYIKTGIELEKMADRVSFQIDLSWQIDKQIELLHLFILRKKKNGWENFPHSLPFILLPHPTSTLPWILICKHL